MDVILMYSRLISVSLLSSATRYGMDGPGIESRLRDEIFLARPDPPWGQPSLLDNGYRVIPRG
jgi:hypothetical protein